MDKLSNIIAFTTVAETSSFAEAARRLNLATSVVSKRIKDLETYLGTQLLKRSTRHVSLTDTGYQYLEQTRRILHELAEVEEHIRYQNENPVGELKVSAPVSFGIEFLSPAICGYMAQYPDVTVTLSLTDLTVDLSSGGYDIAIAIGDVPIMSAIMRKIAQSRRVIVASPDYLRQHGTPEKPQDLIRHNCMAYTHHLDGRHWSFVINGRKVNQPIAGSFAANNGLILKQAALAHRGIIMLPSFLVAQEIMTGKLDIILADYEDTPLPIQVAWLQQRLISARMRTFIDYMGKYFSGFAA